MIPKTAGRFNHTREDSPRTPCDECAPPGFVDFVSAVRRRLEPFGVEVRFEIDKSPRGDEFVTVFSGLSEPRTNQRRTIPVRALMTSGIATLIAAMCKSILGDMQDDIATMPEDKINGRFYRKPQRTVPFNTPSAPFPVHAVQQFAPVAFYPKPLTITISGETSDPIAATVIDLRPTRNMTTGEKIVEPVAIPATPVANRHNRFGEVSSEWSKAWSQAANLEAKKIDAPDPSSADDEPIIVVCEVGTLFYPKP